MSRDPLSHKIPPLHIISRSVKVLPFLASLMSFHQRVFLIRQIVFGEFFYAFFFFFLCARLLLFLFTHFCIFCAWLWNLKWQVAWKCCTNIPIRYFNSTYYDALKLGNYRVKNYIFYWNWHRMIGINFIRVASILFNWVGTWV